MQVATHTFAITAIMLLFQYSVAFHSFYFSMLYASLDG